MMMTLLAHDDGLPLVLDWDSICPPVEQQWPPLLLWLQLGRSAVYSLAAVVWAGFVLLTAVVVVWDAVLVLVSGIWSV